MSNSHRFRTNSHTLASLLRRVLASGLVTAPLAWAACGGEVDTTANDAGEHADAATDDANFADGSVPSCGPNVKLITGPNCESTVVLPCGFTGNMLDEVDCRIACGSTFSSSACSVAVEDGGVGGVFCGPCGTGRRPTGFRARRRSATRDGDVVTAWLVDAAALEAASVAAFVELRKSLIALGAPRRLLDACTRAASDERRHARAVAALAGTKTLRRAPVRRKVAAPSLEALAVENVREGCVRETYGALAAMAQAARASDGRTRRVMRSIAADETRHAALAWRVHSWAMDALSADARARVLAAARTAQRTLLQELAAPPPPEVRVALGVPSSGHAIELARGLQRSMTLDAPAA